jgi:hypothetical protein
MERKTRSMRGEEVNFDLLEIKQKIGEKPTPIDVENREKFVFSKRKRRGKKVIDNLLHTTSKPVSNITDTKNDLSSNDKITKRIIKKNRAN